jgi:hypothetical protein
MCSRFLLNVYRMVNIRTTGYIRGVQDENVQTVRLVRYKDQREVDRKRKET